MKSLWLFCLLFAIAFTVQSQTIIPGGYVSGTWASTQSPFHIQGNIEIPFDSTLIIEPGVNVYFDGSYKMTVHGRLHASGTVNDSILFTANDQEVGWKGIDFYQINEEMDSSLLIYCIFTYTKGTTNGNDGALNIYQSDHLSISHCRISNNYAQGGGGISIKESNIILEHSVISDNRAPDSFCGGISCVNSVPSFFDLLITRNEAFFIGGLYFDSIPADSNPFFRQIEITKNKSGNIGGLIIQSSNGLVLDDCRICYNKGGCCGGIGFYDGSTLDCSNPEKRSQVYMNRGEEVNELYSYDGQDIDICIDTFTVWSKDDYHVFPTFSFNFIGGIQYGLIETVDDDLFISTTGNDTNDGLSAESALRSFDYALRKIKRNNENINTLWALPGLYHLSESDSNSSIILKDYIRIAATDAGQAIIDGDSVTRVLLGYNLSGFRLSGLKIQNGFSDGLGGGFRLINGSGEIDSCTFISNCSEEGGGACLGNCRVNFHSCSFIQNASTWRGAGLSYCGTGYDGNAGLYNCSFIENHSESIGGGLFCDGCNIEIKKCLFSENLSDEYGGGICVTYPKETNIINCSFNKNTAELEGGGMIIYHGVYAKVINSTFSDNIATLGSAIYQYDFSNLLSVNSIYWNKEVPPTDLIYIINSYLSDSSSFFIDYSNLQGGESSIVLEGDGARYYWEVGNFTTDPAFIDPANNEYSLNWNSPCIEAGKEDTTGLHLPETDLNGDPRIVNPRIDMGAYEFQFPVGLSANKLAENSFKIYPAITRNIVNIEFPEGLTDKPGLIKIYSASGNELEELKLDQGMNKIEVDVSGFPSGIYYVSFQNSSMRRSIGRFIVIK